MIFMFWVESKIQFNLNNSVNMLLILFLLKLSFNNIMQTKKISQTNKELNNCTTNYEY